MKVWVARRKPKDAEPVILSAWPDVYDAKFEAQRWEEDSKVPHDYVEGVLIIAPHAILDEEANHVERVGSSDEGSEAGDGEAARLYREGLDER